MREGVRVVVSVLFVALAVTAPVMAQDVSVRAYLDRAEVGLNQLFVLNVEISGTQDVEAEPEFPDLSGFATYLGSGRSTSMQIINGRTTLSLTLQYRFQAHQEGTFEIGSVAVRAAGDMYRTEPLSITVTSNPARPSPGAAPETGLDLDAEDLFVTAEVDRRSVYENEPVVVEYRIYTRVNVESYSVTSLPGTAGFWVEELESDAPQVERMVRDGLQYVTARIRKVALFPTGPGTRTVEPLAIEAQVRVRRRSRDLFEEFSESLFGRRVPVGRASEPIEIEVLPLPEEGRPNEFSGFVGRLELAASVDRTEAETNQAVSLIVRMTGEGNVRALPEPNVAVPAEFEVYPPEVSEQVDRGGERISGSRTLEYVLIPRAPGTQTIPSIEMSYFDPARRAYATAASDPITIEVTGAPLADPLVAGRSRGGIEPLRADIRFIHIETPSFRPVGRSVFSRASFWIVLLIPLLGVGGAVGLRRHRDRLEGDVAYARRRRASRMAKKRLAQAGSLRAENKQREFYAEVDRALEGFLADKLNLPEAGLIADEVLSRLKARGVPEDAVNEYLACLEQCDRQRFAPAAASLEEMNAFWKRAARAMTRLNEGLSR